MRRRSRTSSWKFIETPSPYAMFGIKGIGENGAIGPPAAIANAVNDALRPLKASIFENADHRQPGARGRHARSFGGRRMKPAPLSYSRPEALSGVSDALQQSPGDVRVIAGGQSLGPMLNFRLAQPRQLVDISRIDALCTAAMEGGALAIGACVTHSRIEDGEIPDVTLGLMRHIARGIAYRAVRNRGTIGGSLAHADPAADWLAAMIALDASVRLQSKSRVRQLKVADFVVGALDTRIAEAEVISHVLVPPLTAQARWGHSKYAKSPGISPSWQPSRSSTESAALYASYSGGGLTLRR